MYHGCTREALAHAVVATSVNERGNTRTAQSRTLGLGRLARGGRFWSVDRWPVLGCPPRTRIGRRAAVPHGLPTGAEDPHGHRTYLTF